MTKGRKMIYTLVVMGFMSVAFLTWYSFRYGMDVAPSFEVNSPQATPHILIASQGSEFKNDVVVILVDALKPRSPYIKVIDVSLLSGIRENDWTAIVILHTWEAGHAEKTARAFVSSCVNRDALIVVTTSGDGTHVMEDVDGISSASLPDQTQVVAQQILERLEMLLPRNEMHN